MRRCCSSCETSASPAAAARSSTRSAPGYRPGATAIVGPSGSGKSTLLRLLNRLADPDARRDLLPRPAAGRATTRWRCGARSRWSRSCRRCWRARSSRTSRYAAAARRHGARREPLPAPRRPRPRASPSATSPSSRSASSSGRCWPGPLRSGREVLLLDEPTSALDHDARDAIEATLAELRRELEISLVLVTHDPEQARRLGEWVVRLEAGRVVGCRPAGGGAGVSTVRSSVDRLVARSPPRSPWSPSPRRSPSGGRPTSSATSASPRSARSSS